MNQHTVRAGEYVLGVLSPDERVAVERDAASDPELAAEIAFWSEQFMPLLDAVEVEPPAGLFDRIRAGISSQALPAQDLAGTVTVRAAEGAWVRLGRGIDRKILHRAPSGRLTYLVRGQPGARLPAHQHDDDEEIYVLEGDLTLGPLTLRAGDYHLAPRGFHHPTATTAGGCLLLVNAAA
jgi:quercetin dioxygenase-like cupin family protein